MSVGKGPIEQRTPDQNGDPGRDVWFVAVSRSDIRQMSIDQLDEALNAGVIELDTLVWRAGFRDWWPLGKVAGLDEDVRTQIVWPDDAALPASARGVLVALATSRVSGAVTEAAGVDSGSSLLDNPRGISHTPLSLAPVAITADKIQSAGIPGSVGSEQAGTAVRPLPRIRAAYWLIGSAALSFGVLFGFYRGHWLELWLARPGTEPVEHGAALPAPGGMRSRHDPKLGVEPSESEANDSVDKLDVDGVPLPTFRLQGNALVPIVPATQANLATDESVKPKTVQDSAPQVDPKPVLPRLSRSNGSRATARERHTGGERTRKKPVEASPATADDPAAQTVGTDPTETDSAFDPLNDSLP